MKYLKLLFLTILCNSFSFAQVGVNTTTIDASAALDIQYGSTPKGLLTPRMTTVQKLAISNPADGLMVYDTDLKSFYHYKAGSPGAWIRMSSEATGRLNFKRIKSTDVLATVLADEKAAGGGTRYLLNTNTYYEINGTINLDLPIGINNAYVVGLDANEDKLVKTSGNLFEGTKGGTIKNITITATSGNAFSLVGTAAENLIIRDCIVAGCSNVGSISGYGLVFCSVIQYAGNTTGITYSNINQLLISNTGWFGNNTGTFETFTGTFNLIQKLGGFCEVNGTAVGVDVSANPVINGDAVMESVVFTGANTSGYVKPYLLTAPNTYTGYNFNSSWNIRCAGIPNETDAAAVGEFSFDYEVGQGGSTSFNNSVPSNTVKVVGTSTSANLFRFSTGGVSNRLVYLGKKKRSFQLTGSISFQVPSINTYIIYVAKGGTVISKYKVYGRATVANDIVVLPLNALVELSNGEYIEVYAQRYSGTNTINDAIVTPNMTLVLK